MTPPPPIGTRRTRGDSRAEPPGEHEIVERIVSLEDVIDDHEERIGTVEAKHDELEGKILGKLGAIEKQNAAQSESLDAARTERDRRVGADAALRELEEKALKARTAASARIGLWGAYAAAAGTFVAVLAGVFRLLQAIVGGHP